MKYIKFILICFMLSIVNVQALSIDCKKTNKITCSISSADVIEFSFDIDNAIDLKCIGNNNIELTCENNHVEGKVINKTSKLGMIEFDTKEKVSINNIKSIVNTNSKPNSNWLFIGDSYFDFMDTYKSVRYNYKINYNDSKGYPDLNKVKFVGKAGIKIQDVYPYIKNIDYTNINNIVIYLGTNNMWQMEDLKYSKKEMKKLIKYLHKKSSNSKIYILELFGAGKFNKAKNIIKLNDYYEDLEEKYSYVECIDTRKSLIDNNDILLRNYRWHLTESDYKIWVENIINTFNLNTNYKVIYDRDIFIKK